MNERPLPPRPARLCTVVGLAALAAALVGAAHAADVTIQPPAGNGFVVKDSGGATDRLRVQDNGQVTLPAVPAAATQAQNLCIGATGVLGPCAGSSAYSAGTGMALAASTFSIAPTFQLPQACAAGQVPSWNGAAWTCGSAGQTYTAGTGLALAANTFSLAAGYQLPQACTTGQVPQWGGAAWTCATVSGAGGLVGKGTPNVVAKWADVGMLSDSAIYDDSKGHVGIGTNAPRNSLQVGNVPSSWTGYQLAIGDSQSAMGFTQDRFWSGWESNGYFYLQGNGGNGTRLGIGALPRYSLHVEGADPQIGMIATNGPLGQLSGATISRYTNRLEISPNDAFQVSVGGIAHPHFWIGHDGNVGVATTAPVSRLQIGSVGASGYRGNDIAFGNGTQASGIAQLAGIAQWYSTTDIALMPQGGRTGRVGINTTTPHVPLEVQSYLPVHDDYIYLAYTSGNLVHDVSMCWRCNANVSIYASDNVMAEEFDVYSDIRIKDVIGVSDSASDLATINALQVVDYTLKDKIRNGDKRFKKVVAQQVESVYPQVVAKHVDFVPNVYRAAVSVARTRQGLLLHFADPHQLSPGAKRVRVLVSGESAMRTAAVVARPSEHDIVIEAPPGAGDRIFVYGEEVDDFRTVDYEGIAMLNVSATQEIAKRLARQQAELADKDAQLAALRDELAAQQARVAELAGLADELAQIRAQVAALRRSTAPGAPQAIEALLRP